MLKFSVERSFGNCVHFSCPGCDSINVFPSRNNEYTTRYCWRCSFRFPNLHTIKEDVKARVEYYKNAKL